MEPKSKKLEYIVEKDVERSKETETTVRTTLDVSEQRRIEQERVQEKSKVADT